MRGIGAYGSPWLDPASGMRYIEVSFLVKDGRVARERRVKKTGSRRTPSVP